MYAQPFTNNLQQLQAMTQSPQIQFLNLTLNNPPYIPQYQGDPYLAQMAPTVAAALAMEIQQNAQKNPLRMFMFNQYGQNAFANADFDALANATLDYIALEMTNRRYRSAEDAAQVCIPQMCEMMCAVNLRIVPGLENAVDPSMVNAIRNTIGTFDQIAAGINAMKAQTQMRPAATGWGQQPQQQGGWGQQQQMAPRGGFSNTQQVNQNVGNHAWRNSGPAAGQMTGGTSSLFQGGNTNTGPVSTGAGASVSPGKYGATAAQEVVSQPFTPRKEMPVNTQAPASAAPSFIPSTPVEVLASSGEIKWKPSAQWPYIPAYVPSSQDLFFTRHPDGSVEPIVKQKEAASMDYDRHATQTSFGPVPKGFDLSNAQKTMSDIEQGIKQLNGATEQLAANKPVTPEITTFVKKQTILDTCESSVWLTGAIERMMAPDGKIPSVYRVYASIADPLISQKDETESINNFGKSSTFIELREKLNAAIPEISAELWGTANLKITSAINRVLSQNLSIPDLTIDSFVADIEDLINHLGNKFGDVIQSAFLKNQRQLINAMFQDFGAAAEDLANNFLDDRKFADGVQPKITFLASNYSMTFLNCVAHELDIGLAQGVAVAVTKELAPIVNELLVGLFKDADARGDTFLRHLIRTNDGRILEASRGYIKITGDFYLLTLIK